MLIVSERFLYCPILRDESVDERSNVVKLVMLEITGAVQVDNVGRKMSRKERAVEETCFSRRSARDFLARIE